MAGSFTSVREYTGRWQGVLPAMCVEPSEEAGAAARSSSTAPCKTQVQEPAGQAAPIAGARPQISARATPQNAAIGVKAGAVPRQNLQGALQGRFKRVVLA